MLHFLVMRDPRSLGGMACGGALLAVAARVSADSGGGRLDTGDLGQALAALAIFLVLLLVLGRWAWRPIVSQLQRREEAIADAVERAEKREKASEGMLAEYQGRLETAEIEAKELLSRSRMEAAAAKQAAVADGREEAKKVTERAREEIEQAKEAAVRELQEMTAELATEIAGRLIGEADPSQRRRMVSRSIQEIRGHVEDRS